MATLAIMIGGAILNATAFIGGSTIARSMSGNARESDAERKRHDLALEKYQKDYEDYQRKKEQFETWQYQRGMNEDGAAVDFENIDEALQYYNSTHKTIQIDDSGLGNEPNFSNYYKPNDSQKTGELIYVGGGMLGIGYLASRYL